MIVDIVPFSTNLLTKAVFDVQRRWLCRFLLSRCLSPGMQNFILVEIRICPESLFPAIRATHEQSFLFSETNQRSATSFLLSGDLGWIPTIFQVYWLAIFLCNILRSKKSSTRRVASWHLGILINPLLEEILPLVEHFWSAMEPTVLSSPRKLF